MVPAASASRFATSAANPAAFDRRTAASASAAASGSSNGATTAPVSRTMAVISDAGTSSWSGLRTWVPSAGTRWPIARRTVVGRPSSTLASSPVATAGSTALVVAQTTNGTPAAYAARAMGYVPVVAMTSPFAAIRSAPARTTLTSLLAMQPGAAASVRMACGTPAWRSSQAAIREPSKDGLPSGTRAWTGRPSWWSVATTESAVPNVPLPMAPVLPTSMTWSWSSGPPGRTGTAWPTTAPWSSAASRMIASASVRSVATTTAPSSSATIVSRSASIRSSAAAIGADAGRERRNALAAPRIVARRANGLAVTAREATMASVAAAICAWTVAPTTTPSLMALMASAAPWTWISVRASGRRRWSTSRMMSSSHLKGAR